MKVLLNALIICSVVLLVACSKPIHGKLADNFGLPVANAEVKIKDSDFKTISNEMGEFSLDYAPGKIEISFHKDGHLLESRVLEISQKSNYPIGTVELIRLPKEPGMYIKDSVGYTPLQIVKLKKDYHSMQTIFGKSTITVYSISPDSIIRRKEKLDRVEIFQYKTKNINLLGPNKNNVLFAEDMFGCIPQQWLVDEQRKKGEDLVIRSFVPQPNIIYAYTYGLRDEKMKSVSLRNVKDYVYTLSW